MKRTIDIVVALCAIAALALPLLVAAAVAALASHGPVFFGATRVGCGGRPFRMHKWRTMSVGMPGPGITRADDPRITRCGRFLRRTRIDELPQFWNVLVGDMSLVGPRPEDPRFVDTGDPVWQQVLSVRPGMTGPAQLEYADREQALLGAEDPERDYRERVLPAKLRADLAYVRSKTLRGDLALLRRTLSQVIGARG